MRVVTTSATVSKKPDTPRQSESRQPECKVFRNGKADGQVQDFDDISEILNEPGTLVWFDVVDPEPADLEVLREEFDLHPLAIEDAVQAHERPKIESYGSYWFVIVQAASMADEHINLHEIAIFAGKNFLVTVRHEPLFDLDEIAQRWSNHPEQLRTGGGFLLYTILDTVVDGYLPVAQQFQDHVDDIEEALFSARRSDDSVPARVFSMKKDAQRFRWAVLPMRDILNPIIRHDNDLFPEQDTAYFRDVYDHAVLVIEQLDSLRDLVTSALEIHMSAVANRQNEVSKQLTVIATIFLPLTFITGFFGQNFGWLIGHIGGGDTFIGWGLGTEVVVVLLTVGYFKLKGWF
jgi:magnesium transporter